MPSGDPPNLFAEVPKGWVPTYVCDRGLAASESESVIRALEAEIVRLEKELLSLDPSRKKDPIPPLEEELITGQVILRDCCPGSRSVYDRVAIKQDDGRTWLIRRPYIDPSKDEKLYNLLGKRITATGYIHGFCFVVTSVLIRNRR